MPLLLQAADATTRSSSCLAATPPSESGTATDGRGPRRLFCDVAVD
jgi:hypothetical protein